jgi:ribulose bisphosphate carboxylase small subunit
MSQAATALAQPPKYDFAEIRNLLQGSFMRDWAISIEYAVTATDHSNQWRRWDKPLFALRDADPVIDNIMACCKANPDCSMKMVCEHFSPQYRCIYYIYRQNPANDGPDVFEPA